MNQATEILDVREDIRAGRDPFKRIMETVARLKESKGLRLIAPFEPVPLFDVMVRRGFSHEAHPMSSGDWEVTFTRGSGMILQREETSSSSSTHCGCGPVQEVDTRGLEPPQPLVVILETLARLPCNASLRAHTDRRPLHLYAHLEDHGFVGDTKEQADGSFITTIRRG